MNAALKDRELLKLRKELIAQLKELYAWRPERYRAIGLGLLALLDHSRCPYEGHILPDLARDAGILKSLSQAKRAPSLLYLCLQLARVPDPDFETFRKQRLSWAKIRLRLRERNLGQRTKKDQKVSASGRMT